MIPGAGSYPINSTHGRVTGSVWSMIEIVKEPEWLPTTCVDHRFTTHPLTETTPRTVLVSIDFTSAPAAFRFVTDVSRVFCWRCNR